jgi:protein SCO1/2
MRRSRRFLAALGTLAALAAGCGSEEPEALRGIVRDPPLEVADVHLPEASTSTLVPMTAPEGELHLVYFGYTSCPDVCPTTLSDISVALDDLPDDLAERVTVAMTTVDPERDTADVLTGYLDHFFDDGLALRTDDPAQLSAAAAAFGVQFEVAPHEDGDAYDVSHTAMTYVVDDTGTVVVEWPFGFETESMTSDLTDLLRRDTTT